MIAESDFLRREIRHIKWARKNGMSHTIYDDYLATFKRRINELEKIESIKRKAYIRGKDALRRLRSRNT